MNKINNKSHWIQATNLPEEINREFLHKVFGQFGKILKIYIHPESTFCKVYFDNKASAEEAGFLNGKAPYYLAIEVHSEVDRFKSSNTSVTLVENKKMSYNNNEDVYADTGPELYNIHGLSVSTLTADDGKLYVAVDEVKSVGFELFEDHAIPRNIKFDEQMLCEFKAYLSHKARKYIRRMKCNISENIVEEMKNDTIQSYISHAAPRNTSRRSDYIPPLLSVQTTPSFHQNGSIDGQRNSRNRESNFDNTFETQKSFRNTTRDESSQSESQKPLRKPNNFNDQKLQFPSNARNTESNRPARNQNTNRTKNISNFEKENISPKEEDIPVRKPQPRFENVKEDISPKEQDIPVPKQPSVNASVPAITRINLPLNKPVRVVVSYVVNTQNCWVFMKNNEEKLQELLYEINQEATKKSGSKPVVGQICASTYCGAWYRAVVLEDTPTTKVQYLDFGNFNDEVVKEVRELSTKITSQPVFAVCLNFSKPPKTKLEDNVELNIIAVNKNTDGSYDVSEVGEKDTRSSSSELIQLKVVPAGQIVKCTPSDQTSKSKPTKSVTNSKEKPPPRENRPQEELRPVSARSNASIVSQKNEKRPESAGRLTLKEKLLRMSDSEKVRSKSLNPDRKAAVDLLSADEGMLQFVKKLDENRCLCAILPGKFIDDIGCLDEITEESKSASKIKGKVGDTVCVEKEDNGDMTWVRGTIIDVKNDKYIVALVDYGTIITTDTVAQLQRKYMDIPEFSCVCSGNAECNKLMEAAKEEMTFTSTENNKISIGFNNIFYEVSCSRWNPFESSITNEKVDEPVIFTTAPTARQLNADTKTVIVMLNDGKLLVRNQETNALFTKIRNDISNYNALPLEQKPIVNQLILCPHDSINGLCRGIVQSLNNNYAEVEFIDYGFVETVPLKNIRNISESLAKEDSSLITIILKGFEDGKYTDDAVEFIGTYSQERKKLIAKKYPNDVFDFVIDEAGNFLSSKLKNLSVSSNVLKFKDMAKRELKVGDIKDMLYMSFDDDGSMILMLNEDTNQEFLKLIETISEYASKNNMPYTPVVDEVCLAKFEGDWFRAKVSEINKAVEEYEVYYIDYGNTAKIASSDIRKMPEEFGKTPALALHCCLTELLTTTTYLNPEIMDKLKDVLDLGSSYTAKVLQRVDDLYEIEISSVSKQILKILDV